MFENMFNGIMGRIKSGCYRLSTVRADLCGYVDEDSHMAALKTLRMQQVDVI